MNSKSFLAVGICVLAMLFSVVNTSDAYTGGGAWGGGSLGFGGGCLLYTSPSPRDRG